jgi:hypothetical protein
LNFLGLGDKVGTAVPQLRRGAPRGRRTVVTAAMLCAVAVGTGVAIAGVGSVFDSRPPYGNPGGGCDRAPERQQKEANGANQPLCGSRYGDKLKASRWGGHHMDGYQGNDVFRADNKSSVGDEIVGGPGRDTAYIDKNDEVIGVEVCKPIKCPKPSASLAALTGRPLSKTRVGEDRAGEDRFTVYRSRIECRLSPSEGKRQMWFLVEPQIRAADASSRIDWQTVAWSPALYKLVGTEWVLDVENIWLFDRTSDARPVGVPQYFNWWRRFTGKKERWFVWFEPPQPGTYQVRLRYYGYKTTKVPAYRWEDDAESVDPHYSSEGFEGPTHKWCVFP